MDIEGFIEYQKREFCNTLPCKVQVLLNQQEAGSEAYEQIRSICKTNCIHTTHEVHAWLIEKRYLGIRIDLTDESALDSAFESFINAFSGFDMLVLNAGIFPPGIRIEALGMADWRKVMAINLDPNLSMMRRARARWRIPHPKPLSPSWDASPRSNGQKMASA